jgi:hypothetical protein
MARPNLKEIRDVLNQIPEDTLKVSSIAIDFATTDNPDGEFKVMWLGDEDTWENHSKAFAKGKKKMLTNFVGALNKDLEQAKIREGEKGYDEEYNIEGDW